MISKNLLGLVQQQFIECLEHRDPIYFLRQDLDSPHVLEEVELWKQLKYLHNDELELLLNELTQQKDKELTLVNAAQCYLQSPAYNAAVELLELQFAQFGD